MTVLRRWNGSLWEIVGGPPVVAPTVPDLSAYAAEMISLTATRVDDDSLMLTSAGDMHLYAPTGGFAVNAAALNIGASAVGEDSGNVLLYSGGADAQIVIYSGGANSHMRLAADDVLILGGIEGEGAPQTGTITFSDSSGTKSLAELISAGPFYVVASAETSAERKALAQWVCDGTADEVQINAACAAADTGAGGTVLLLEGDYYLADSIITGYTHNFVGSGRESTYIYFDRNGDAGPMVNVSWGPYNDEYGIVFRSSGYISDFYLSVENNSATGYRGGIALRGENPVMERVTMNVATNEVTQPLQNAGVRMQGNYCVVRDCEIEAPIAFDLSADQNGQRMEANRVYAAVGVWMNGTAEDIFIIGNYMHGWGRNGATPYQGFQDGELYVYGNDVGVAAFAGGTRDPIIVMGNRISNFKNGIVIEGVEYVNVVGNIVFGSSFEGEGTGIKLMDGAWYNYIASNMVRMGQSSDGFLHGIEVQAGAGENQVGPNDLWMSGSVSPYIDAGTGTRQGLLIYSPDGTAYDIRVANGGALSAVEVTPS
jgi:hypothetical protein